MSLSRLPRALCTSCRRSQSIRLASTALAFAHPHSDALEQEQPSGAKRRKRSTRKSSSPTTSEPIRPKVLGENKVQEYLEQLAATGDRITLDDIERLRPSQYSTPGSDQYASEYNALLDSISRSFSVKQLRTFLRMYGVKFPRSRTKWTLATTIMEKQWGWPSLTEIQRQQRDWTEVALRTFPLELEQLFLILGKDGGDLLTLSAEYNVHVSFSSHPFALKVEGLRGALDQLEEHLEKLKSETSRETLQLPTIGTLSPSLVQRISRLSGAFVRDLGHGEIRISYKRSDPRSLFIAKRLAMQATCEISDDGESSATTTLVHVPPGTPTTASIPLTLFQHTYALYPFVPSQELSWMVSGSRNFRLRRVGGWIGGNTGENIWKTGGLAMQRGTVVNKNGDVSSIQETLLASLNAGSRAEDDGTPISVKASIGHLVLPCQSTSKATLLAPVTGNLPLGPVLRSMRAQSLKSVFSQYVPTLPPNASTHEQILLHRLVYRAVPSDTSVSRFLNVEVILKPGVTSSGPATEDSETQQSLLDENIVHKVTIGRVSVLKLMLPDRPMDLEFTAFAATSMNTDATSQEIRQYLTNLYKYVRTPENEASQPEPPLSTNVAGVDYILFSNCSVRQRTATLGGPDEQSTTRFTIEAMMDLDGNEKHTIAQVTCTDMSNATDWTKFMRSCDRLSTYTTSTQYTKALI